MEKRRRNILPFFLQIRERRENSCAYTAGNAIESRRSITRKFPFPRSLYRADGRRAAGSINAGGTNGNCNERDPSAMAID